ncbi:Sugar lactone lactonase YvrE [Duganella sacchari]|uniref:Sugar lactone lactonase YvrE n=1 Tax=Duganella sacchari TaxID=551987 RepID=A0A1M7PUD1_9BURK|nr:SMP-30/gluconolactonase/LRE family protein [Duganella sacchari]SHN21030.1 Sugar lactone lactonase YvrE [Duganella sacchari]
MERVSGVSCTVGESPTWNAAEGAWYWVDIPARRVWRMDGASGAARSWDNAEMVACVSAKAGGGLIAGMETGIFSLELGAEPAARAIKLATPVSGLGEGMRFNDGRCDRQGRFWSGTMFMDMGAARPVGQLFRYDAARGISAPFVSELITQNGTAFSPDGRTMYLSDSHPTRRMVWAFDYDIDDGVPGNRRVFADMTSYAGRPDGAAVDADGCYWICGNDGGCVLRFTPDGKLDRRIDVPMLKPSMCAFGGKDLETLLVTSIVSGKPEDAEWGGAVVMLRPGVKGVAETLFGA